MENTKQFILNAYNFRHACKKFDKTKKVSEEDFSFIMETARLSPSSFGFEPWKFLVTKDFSLLEKIKPYSWGALNSLEGASYFVIILARKKADLKYDSDYIKYMMEEVQKLPSEVIKERKEGFKNFEINDFKLLENDRAIFDWACKQTYIALGNMLTTAAMLKIDSCPIEGFNRVKVEEVLQSEGLIDTTHFGVSCMVSFGYRKKEPHEKARQPIEKIVEELK